MVLGQYVIVACLLGRDYWFRDEQMTRLNLSVSFLGLQLRRLLKADLFFLMCMLVLPGCMFECRVYV